MWLRVDWYLLPTFRYIVSVQWSSGPQNIDDLTTNLVSITSEKSGDLMYTAAKVDIKQSFMFIDRENISVCL